MTDRTVRWQEQEIEGTGLCPEAQADGVPCTGPRRLCHNCDKAAPRVPPTSYGEDPGPTFLDRAGL